MALPCLLGALLFGCGPKTPPGPAAPAAKPEDIYWHPEPTPPTPLATPAPTPAPEPVPAAEPAPAPSPSSTSSAPLRDATRATRSALGVNIGAVDYFAKQIMFLDLMKQAPDWGLNNGGVMPKVDKQGWPKAILPGHRAGFVTNSGKGGRYVILYEGAGKIGVSANGSEQSSSPGRVVVQLNGGETHFTIEMTSPANPIRNVHIVPIENEKDYDKQIFHPKFLALVRPFSLLRFMDYLHTNMSTHVHWSDRATPDYFSQGSPKGAALEYAIELCNRVQADCWFNIPHMADDDYIRRFAELVRDKLDPALKAYVEYSNEVWNFSHGDWIQKAGEKAGMPKEWDTRLRYQARRSIHIFDAFEKALGKKRLVRVLAGQCWDLRLQILLDAEKAYQHADALAIAPYFAYEITEDENIPKLKGLSPEQVMARASEGIDKMRGLLKTLKKVADDHKLPLIGYEGGQHMATGGQFHEDVPLQDLLNKANRIPAMGAAYNKYLDLWRDEGGQVMVLYKLVEDYSKWGRWGLLEDMWQPVGSAPKYMASVSFMQRQPRWWNDAVNAGAE